MHCCNLAVRANISYPESSLETMGFHGTKDTCRGHGECPPQKELVCISKVTVTFDTVDNEC